LETGIEVQEPGYFETLDIISVLILEEKEIEIPGLDGFEEGAPPNVFQVDIHI
jgi:hypothetical protein